jgi:hypothetical protein
MPPGLSFWPGRVAQGGHGAGGESRLRRRTRRMPVTEWEGPSPFSKPLVIFGGKRPPKSDKKPTLEKKPEEKQP